MKKIIVFCVLVVIAGVGYLYLNKRGDKDNKTEPIAIQTVATTPKDTPSSTPVVTKPQQTPVLTSSPLSSPKTIASNNYTNTKAGFSIDLPSGWKAQDAGAAAPYIATSFLDSSGKLTTSDVAFSISLTPRKFQEDAYIAGDGKKPTTQQMVDGFIRSQEDNDENWSLVGTQKTNLSGFEAYVITAKYGGDYATSKTYLVFTPDKIFNITRMIANSKLAELEAVLNKSILTFKAF